MLLLIALKMMSSEYSYTVTLADFCTLCVDSWEPGLLSIEQSSYVISCQPGFFVE